MTAQIQRQAVAATAGSPDVLHERWQLSGIELEVLRGGAGAPLIVLHGANTFRGDTPFLASIGVHREVLAPSLPGFGNSPRPETFDTMYDLVHLCLELIDSLPAETVSLAGFSFGGWLAAEIAVQCAHKLDSLILVDPLGIKTGPRESRDITHFFNTHPAEINRRAWHEPMTRSKGTHGLGWQLDVNSLSDEDLVLRARNWDALSIYAWRPHLYNPQLKRWLHRIRIPTLLLWGASDRIVTPAYGCAYRDLIPGARLEIIPEAGHHPEIEQPALFTDIVLKFLQGAPVVATARRNLGNLA